ncbi:MAG: hypothetical protein KKB32_05125 [Acidobacteria bacterium]|nr:hypothetical protein [Acidobacteriota bacterium]
MNNTDEIDNTIAKANKDQARIEQTLSLSRSMADLVKAMQTPHYLTGIAKIAKSIQPPAYLSVVSQMMTAMQREHQLFTELIRPPRFMDDIIKEMAQMQKLSARITTPYHSIQEIIRSQSAVFEKLSAQIAAFSAIKFSIPQFSQATLALNVASIGLANRMKDIGLLTQREMLSARLFEPHISYTNFVKHTVERLTANPTPHIAARLRGSLNLVEQQLLDNVDIVSNFIELPDDEDKPDDRRVLNAPFKQQDELLAYDAIEDETDTEAMTVISTTAQTVQRGRRVLALVTQCNEAGKTSKIGMEIFKPTTRLMIVFTDLPWISPTDQSGFAEMVDCLYFIFYEGAGKDNLRFLEKNGGPLTDADCDLIWCIKHLRNKWLRHDADHGEKKDIQKSWAELARISHKNKGASAAEP